MKPWGQGDLPLRLLLVMKFLISEIPTLRLHFTKYRTRIRMTPSFLVLGINGGANARVCEAQLVVYRCLDSYFLLPETVKNGS